MMIQARRLGHAVIGTPAIAAQAQYYRDVLGLAVISQNSDFAVLATKAGEEAIVLKRREAVGIVGLSFQVSPNIDLDDVKTAIAAAGIEVQILDQQTPGVSKVVRFRDVNGLEIDLFNEMKFAPVDLTEGAISPLKLGHVGMFTPDVTRCAGFYCSVLGFKRSDWIDESWEFLRCGPDHHTVNFFRNDKITLHHIAFQVRDYSELSRANDLLRRNDLVIDWGPARHIIGHNISSYHRNRDGVRIELFCELDQMLDEELGFYEPRPWHEDRPQRPKNWPKGTGRNYWLPHEP